LIEFLYKVYEQNEQMEQAKAYKDAVLEETRSRDREAVRRDTSAERSKIQAEAEKMASRDVSIATKSADDLRKLSISQSSLRLRALSDALRNMKSGGVSTGASLNHIEDVQAALDLYQSNPEVLSTDPSGWDAVIKNTVADTHARKVIAEIWMKFRSTKNPDKVVQEEIQQWGTNNRSEAKDPLLKSILDIAAAPNDQAAQVAADHLSKIDLGNLQQQYYEKLSKQVGFNDSPQQAEPDSKRAKPTAAVGVAGGTPYQFQEGSFAGTITGSDGKQYAVPQYGAEQSQYDMFNKSSDRKLAQTPDAMVKLLQEVQKKAEPPAAAPPPPPSSDISPNYLAAEADAVQYSNDPRWLEYMGNENWKENLWTGAQHLSIELDIQGVKGRFSIDTGSVYCCLGRDNLEGLNYAHLKSVKVIGIEGRVQELELINIDGLHIGSITLDGVSFIIVPKEGFNIIGLSALKRLEPWSLNTKTGNFDFLTQP